MGFPSEQTAKEGSRFTFDKDEMLSLFLKEICDEIAESNMENFFVWDVFVYLHYRNRLFDGRKVAVTTPIKNQLLQEQWRVSNSFASNSKHDDFFAALSSDDQCPKYECWDKYTVEDKSGNQYFVLRLADGFLEDIKRMSIPLGLQASKCLYRFPNAEQDYNTLRFTLHRKEMFTFGTDATSSFGKPVVGGLFGTSPPSP